MVEFVTDLKVLLVGGTSNVGKSTLAAELSTQLGWELMSTDSLARHPGRPWKSVEKDVPEHVADYYLSHDVDWLLADVLSHYRRLWPQIAETIRSRTSDPAKPGLILEGSALLPGNLATLSDRNVKACWLTASRGFLETRIKAESGFATASQREQKLIQKFLDRTHAYQAWMRPNLRKLKLRSIDVENFRTVTSIARAYLKVVGERPSNYG